jgi:ribose/xylose/arabinose/galactoside ABC-type transport system permease subunit
LLTTVACAASFADAQYPAGILLLAGTLATFSVVVLGWRYGDRSLGRFDVCCLIGVLVGLALWQLFNSPAIAVMATVVIDLIGALPTFTHAWQKPHEETWITFALGGVGALCTVVVTESLEVTAIAFPLYLTVCNLLLAAVIIGRHKYAIGSEPAELREL